MWKLPIEGPAESQLWLLLLPLRLLEKFKKPFPGTRTKQIQWVFFLPFVSVKTTEDLNFSFHICDIFTTLITDQNSSLNLLHMYLLLKFFRKLKKVQLDICWILLKLIFDLKYLIWTTTFTNGSFLLTAFFETLYFLKLCPISEDFLDNFGKRYKKVFRSIFDQWSKLYFGLNVQPEIQTLKVVYCWTLFFHTKECGHIFTEKKCGQTTLAFQITLVDEWMSEV